MLMPEITINWAEWLVGFINRDPPDSALADERNAIRYGRRTEALRAEADRDLRWIARNGITATVRERMERVWLERNAPAFWPMVAGMSFDEGGRLVVNAARMKSMEAMVALTLAELVSSDAPVSVGECALGSCERLFVRVKGRAGRPRLCCSDAHQDTYQTQWARELRHLTPAQRKALLALDHRARSIALLRRRERRAFAKLKARAAAAKHK